MISCSDVVYDGEKRLVFQTQVLDGNNQPLKNKNVMITIFNEFASDEISNGKTDKNGKITLIFPSPQSEFHIDFLIENDDNSYLNRTVKQINSSNFINYKFVYDKTYLLKNEEVAPLNLTYDNVNANLKIKKITINGIYHLNEDFFDCPFEYFDQYQLPPIYLMKKNQTFQLKYTLVNTTSGQETLNTVDLTIGEESINYTLTY